MIELATGQRVTIRNPDPPRVTVPPPGGQAVVVVPVVGPQGPPGDDGGVELVQATPAAQWSFTHTLGRRPGVAIYLTGGERVLADVAATDVSHVVVTFPAPVAGSLVLT